MPTQRYGFGFGIVENKIYVIGGRNDSTILDAVEVYDPIMDSWDVLTTKLPTPRYDVGSTVYDNKIYIIGGSRGPYYNTSLIERFDPVENKWDTVQSLPNERAALGACAYQNNVYAIGGYHWDSLSVYYENRVEYYNPVLDSNWFKVDSLNTPRSNLGVTVFNNKIYALGGSYYGSLNSVEYYLSNNWYYSEPMPHARSGLGVGSHGYYIYAIGGDDNGMLLKSVDICYVDSFWIEGSYLNYARAHFGVAIVGDTIYVIGGQGISGALSTMEYHLLPLTGIEEDKTEEPQSSYLLPTFVRKGTKIGFTGLDAIRIYNLIGELVAEGTNSVKVNLPQGIYFVRLHREGYPVITKKVVVIK
jgi:N-acetylneuraminic acid mutarotase